MCSQQATVHKLRSRTVMQVASIEQISARIAGGRHASEGRVEILINNESEWGLVCGDGWSLFEATVVCRSLGLGFAEHSLQTAYFGGQNMSTRISGVKCKGHEKSITECSIQHFGASVRCAQNGDNFVAGVICTQELPDLVLDVSELQSSIYLEDRPLALLQCAIEENCVSNSLISANMNAFNWFYERRRLMRFTTRIGNIGTADFKPFRPKHAWLWHSCHRHFHSMEVFAHFELFTSDGKRAAEGHKASFCLEDNFCQQGSPAKYNCSNYGDQGISVGCIDSYLHNIDCQWIDITEMPSGIYQLKEIKKEVSQNV
ncbi:Lysyl oxidase-like protein [Leptotrombidium deliense]|uniref:Lysyl oxidase-like protein n=1 Tax=Leptotrombidium deliense TaxID=299467 RepID=A0A443SW70_9ACAR|nr:Lysyl oxidase-like protein [Leptotrombidium deliense]